ncbi:hypothetical protein KR074_011387, partial [Drosophila pseudoananassae]
DPLTIYKTTNVECGTAPKYSANASCVVKAINWNKAVANMDVYLIGELKNISVRIQIFKRDYTNKMQPFLVDVTINLCDIIQRRSYVPYGRMYWNVLKRYTNINHSCPFSGHMFSREMYLDEKLIPMVLPLGTYKVTFNFFENFQNKPREFFGYINIFIEAMFPFISKRIQNR